MLDALELLDGDRLDPRQSRYAKTVLERLEEKGAGQVLNRSELVDGSLGVEYVDTQSQRLEPEWIVVVLAALVHSGHIVLAIAGRKFDALGLAELAATPIRDLVQFKHIEPPKEWNIPALTALFELLGLAPGMAQLVTQGKDDAVQQLQREVTSAVQKLVLARQSLRDGLTFWSRSVLDEQEAEELAERLDATKTFLESLQAYTTSGRLKNFRRSAEEVAEHRAGFEALATVGSLDAIRRGIEPLASYLSTAVAGLPPDHEWSERTQTVREEVHGEFRDRDKRNRSRFRQQVEQRLAALKGEYVQTYLRDHAKARLGVNADRRKSALLRDPRLLALQQLAAIELMPRQHLEDFQRRLSGLRSCFALTEHDLDAEPICPHCGFKSDAEEPVAAEATLDALDDELDRHTEEWTRSLLANLDEPVTKQNLELLKVDHRTLVADFVQRAELPAPITPDFIQALNEALGNLQKVTIAPTSLREGLLQGGTPATPTEIRERFERYVTDLVGDQDPSKVRIVVE